MGISGKSLYLIRKFAMFINLCRLPVLIHGFVKRTAYGNEPATLVVGKDAYFKGAEAHASYDGMEAGVIVQNEETGEISYRQGTLKLPGETLVGGYAESIPQGTEAPTTSRMEVLLMNTPEEEDRVLNSQWSKKPATMIRKGCGGTGIKGKLFPQSLAGMYVAEEMGAAEPGMPQGDVIDPQTQPAIERKADVQQPVSSMPQLPEWMQRMTFQLESMMIEGGGDQRHSDNIWQHWQWRAAGEVQHGPETDRKEHPGSGTWIRKLPGNDDQYQVQTSRAWEPGRQSITWSRNWTDLRKRRPCSWWDRDMALRNQYYYHPDNLSYLEKLVLLPKGQDHMSRYEMTRGVVPEGAELRTQFSDRRPFKRKMRIVMGKSQREKGKRGKRELAGRLRDH